MTARLTTREMQGTRALPVTALLLLAALAGSCRGEHAAFAPPDEASRVAPSASSSAYPISERGGTPATGPGGRYNRCERIWCSVHGENFFVDHFLDGHLGWILHDEVRGDLFVVRHRTGGPNLDHANASVLVLCGRHVHPWLLDIGGGRPIRHTGFNHALGYGRGHFLEFGTRLEPCCINGLGSAYVHSSAGKRFPFHDTARFRADPATGWQRPFPARSAEAR